MEPKILAGLYKRLYKSFDIRSFEDRLKIQKFVYIVQSRKINLGYLFNFYLYGPYSTDLTRNAYSITDFALSWCLFPQSFFFHLHRRLFWLAATVRRPRRNRWCVRQLSFEGKEIRMDVFDIAKHKLIELLPNRDLLLLLRPGFIYWMALLDALKAGMATTIAISVAVLMGSR